MPEAKRAATLMPGVVAAAAAATAMGAAARNEQTVPASPSRPRLKTSLFSTGLSGSHLLLFPAVAAAASQTSLSPSAPGVSWLFLAWKDKE